MLKGFIYGVLATLVILFAVGYVGVTQGLLIPANADAKPSRMERWMASRSLAATISREMPTQPNPVAATDANYEAGIKLYAENCAACHGAAGRATVNGCDRPLSTGAATRKARRRG